MGFDFQRDGGVPEPKPVPASARDPKAESFGGFSRGFGEFVAKVRDAGMPGMTMDSRLPPLRAAAGSDEQSSGLNTYGGFTVPSGFRAELLSRSGEGDRLAQYVRRIEMANPTLKIPARVDSNHTTSASGGVTLARRSELSQITSSRVEFEQVKLEATMLAGLVYVSEELLEDSAFPFGDLVMTCFRDELASVMMDERLNGNGAGKPLGVLNAACKVSVAKESGQVAETIMVENVHKMRSRCYNFDSPSVAWVINPDAYASLAAMYTPAGTGGSAAWGGEAISTGPQTLLGKPIVWSEHAQTLGTEGDIILGCWSEYLEGLYSGPRMDSSISLRFDYAERAFRFFIRSDGAPWWSAAMTPANSTDTISPFVTLATRA